MLIFFFVFICSYVVCFILWDVVELVYMDFICMCVDISVFFFLLN